MDGSAQGPARTILIHEYVTGGGLAGSDLPGSWAAEGSAMRRALAAEFAALPGVRVAMTLDARLPDEPGPWSVLRIGPGEEPGLLADRAAKADYTLVVAPETNGILFERARIVDRAGGRSLGSLPGAIAEAGNKLVASHRFRAAGVRTPPVRVVSPRDGWPRRITFPLADLLEVCPFVEIPEALADRPFDEVADRELEHPAVLKPVDGAGSIDTFVLSGLADWPDPAWQPELALVQPLVRGTPMGVAALVDAAGRPRVLGVGRQRIAVEGGRICYRGGLAPLRPGTIDAGTIERAIGSIPGLRGWVGVDLLAAPAGEAVVLEINPRPTTSIIAFRAVLPPGTIARGWLDAIGGRDGGRALDRLAGRLAAFGGRPLAFDPDGTIRTEGAGR